MDDPLISHLLEHRGQLLAFVRRKINDPDLAEELLQESLLKALRSAPDLREKEKLLPWFYRILNNAVIDLYRHRAAENRRLTLYAREQEELIGPEDEAVLCGCFRELTLRPEYAQLIDELELSDGDPAQVAERLDITRNNLKVRRHRARQALRRRLEETCRFCAEHGCLDCTCR